MQGLCISCQSYWQSLVKFLPSVFRPAAGEFEEKTGCQVGSLMFKVLSESGEIGGRKGGKVDRGKGRAVEDGTMVEEGGEGGGGRG